jgi:hypothetical protein
MVGRRDPSPPQRLVRIPSSSSRVEFLVPGFAFQVAPFPVPHSPRFGGCGSTAKTKANKSGLKRDFIEELQQFFQLASRVSGQVLQFDSFDGRASVRASRKH